MGTGWEEGLGKHQDVEKRFNVGDRKSVVPMTSEEMIVRVGLAKIREAISRLFPHRKSDSLGSWEDQVE
jgi:hypothetical protein